MGGVRNLSVELGQRGTVLDEAGSEEDEVYDEEREHDRDFWR